ncbi:MAG: stalk domain-containing protein [Tumebacillaceae bacterium]
MKKSWLKVCMAALLFGTISLASIGPVMADSTIPVYIDGKLQTFDQPPVFVNDRMLVPMRAIFEALGAQVKWSADAPSLVVATKGDITISLTIGSKTAYKNGQAVTLDVPPQVIHNRTLVPIRFVSESLGADVKWDSVSKTVQVKTTAAEPVTPPSNNGGQDLTVEQVGASSKSVVLLKILDQNGREVASGSGFVLSADGKILTNYHVIDGAASVKVVFPDNTTYTTSTVLLADKDKDLAELKIDASNLTPLVLGDSSQLHLGQSVVAIGSPKGMQNTLSTGVVSATARDDGHGHSYIQVSTPIDHGSSGGALFDMQGEVVGVTSYGIQSAASLNLAIPSNTVKQFLQGTETPKSLAVLFPKLSLSQIKDLLNSKFGTMTYKSHTFHFKYDARLASDGKSMDFAAFVTDPQEYKDLLDLEASNPIAVADMLTDLMDVLHDNGAFDPLLILFTDLYVKDKVATMPDDEFLPIASGGYEMMHPIAAAFIDPDTGVVMVDIDPDAGRTQSSTNP